MKLSDIFSLPWSFSFTELFTWPDAGGDKCLLCGIIRREHSVLMQKHEFQEAA